MRRTHTQTPIETRIVSAATPDSTDNGHVCFRTATTPMWRACLGYRSDDTLTLYEDRGLYYNCLCQRCMGRLYCLSRSVGRRRQSYKTKHTTPGVICMYELSRLDNIDGIEKTTFAGILTSALHGIVIDENGVVLDGAASDMES